MRIVYENQSAGRPSWRVSPRRRRVCSQARVALNCATVTGEVPGNAFKG